MRDFAPGDRVIYYTTYGLVRGVVTFDRTRGTVYPCVGVRIESGPDSWRAVIGRIEALSTERLEHECAVEQIARLA